MLASRGVVYAAWDAQQPLLDALAAAMADNGGIKVEPPGGADALTRVPVLRPQCLIGPIVATLGGQIGKRINSRAFNSGNGI